MKLTEEERSVAEEFGHLFVSTGGNDPIELMERDGVNYFNNPLVAELQGSCYSQVQIILKLRKLGLVVSRTATGVGPSTLSAPDRPMAPDPGHPADIRGSG